MEYTDWIKPRVFQDDPGFVGKSFAAQIRESGLEEVICELATKAWAHQRGGINNHSTNGHPNARLDMPEPYSYGKRNVLYRLRMPDDTLWMARLYNSLNKKSAIADPTQRLANQRLLLESEIATMQYVKANTQIPVPGVYDYNTTFDNPLATPYMFMDYISGKPYPFPFTEQRPVKDEDLVKIHDQLTGFAWQLARKPFDQIGQLHPAPSSETGVVVGPVIDRKDRLYGPFASSREFYRQRAETIFEFEQTQRSSGIVPTVENSLESAALHLQAAEYAGNQHFSTGPFILQHADMHWQNLLFDGECNIVGVIDWEWSQTVPVDSFNLLPWNFATKMLPFNPENVARHREISQRRFRALAETEEGHGLDTHMVDDIVAFQGSTQQQIARCLDDYNWPETRAKHFDHLSGLLLDMQRAQLVSGNKESVER